MATIQEINEQIKLLNGKTDLVSDGFHTFGELYKHRIHLFIALCTFIRRLMNADFEVKFEIIKSKKHFDGTEFDGWFILQLETPEGQISCHLPIEYWDRCCFAREQDNANQWDGHTSDDVLDRLLKI